MAMKRTKNRSKGGTVRRMGGGKMTKYKSKGGTVRRMGGGKMTKYKSKGGALMAGMTARRNARRGK